MVMVARVKNFVHFLRDRRLIDDAKLDRCVRQFDHFDRRMGQLSTFLGYIPPEQVNTILLEQTHTGDLFGECAMRLKLLSPQQVAQVVRLQTDDLSIFAQAVGMQHAATPVEFTSFLTEFIKSHPESPDEDDALNMEPIGNLDVRIRDVLRDIENIAPLPGTVERVIHLLDDPKVDLDAVADAIRVDPGLTVTLLRVANSAFYGLRSKIGSTKKALQVLGTSKLRQLIIAAGIMQKFQKVPREFAIRFWVHALRTAEACKEIGKYCRFQELDELFVCGLLHNIGELVIQQYFPSRWGHIREITSETKNVYEAERQVLGGTRADIAGFLFSIWKLPTGTIQSAMFHRHDYRMLLNMPSLCDEVFIIHMAADLCSLDPAKLNAYAYDKVLDAVGQQYRARLKYPDTLDVVQLMSRVDATVERFDKENFA